MTDISKAVSAMLEASELLKIAADELLKIDNLPQQIKYSGKFLSAAGRITIPGMIVELEEWADE